MYFFLRESQVLCFSEREWMQDIIEVVWEVQVQIPVPFGRCVALGFLSEFYCTFIEIWTLRRTVVVAVCKIMNSEATGEEKGSGLIMKQFTCSLPLEILSLFTLQGDLFSWNKVGKLEVTIPKIHTEAREELIVEERGSFHKTVVYWAVEWLNILKGVRDLINLGKAAGDRPPVGKRVDRLNGCLLCLILANAEWAYYLDPHNELDKQWNN